MKVAYDVSRDGWKEEPGGPIEISYKTWRMLSREEFGALVIPCMFGFNETRHLIELSSVIDRLQ